MSTRFKSTIKQANKIDYKKVFHIDELFADPNILENHAAKIKQMYPSATDEMIRNQIDQIIIKENSFNLIMQHVVEHYKVTFNKDEVEKYKEKFTSMFNETDAKKATEIAKKIITKGLVFESIAKDNKIVVSDEETKEYLDNYYKTTNNSINEYLNDKDKFNEIKYIIEEEKITRWLLDKFKVYLNVKTIINRNQN